MSLAFKLAHNLVAHPLLAVADVVGVGCCLAAVITAEVADSCDRFHDWTAAKGWPEDFIGAKYEKS